MQDIEKIYKQYSKTVYKYLFCLTASEDISEELTQETFAIAVKEIHKFKGNCKVSVWLCQIAKHLWYKELKKKSNKNISLERKLISANIGKTFIMSLDTDNHSTGKECYILRKNDDKSNNWEIWIDRNTGLVVKEIQREAIKEFITGTNIVKKLSDSIVEYQ